MFLLKFFNLLLAYFIFNFTSLASHNDEISPVSKRLSLLKKWSIPCLESNNVDVKDLQSLVKNFERTIAPIAIIDVESNKQNNSPTLNEYFIYGADVKEQKAIGSHFQSIAEILLGIADQSKLLITEDPQEIVKHGTNILNLSIGLDDPWPVDPKSTYDLLRSLHKQGKNQFIEKFKKYIQGTFSCQESHGSDEYFLDKNKNKILQLIDDFEENFEEYLNSLKEAIIRQVDKDKRSISCHLNGQCLIVQSLSNKPGQLTEDNCIFLNLTKINPFRESIIFVRNLYYSVKKNTIINPSSELPSTEFADRTICVVLPVDEDKDLPDELIYDISNNSAAAPWVSACAYYVNLVYFKKVGRLPSSVELSKSILETATPKYDLDEKDKIPFKDRFHSTIYGVGILNMKAALNYAKKL